MKSTFSRGFLPRQKALAAALSLGSLMVITHEASAALFGTMCQREYQDGWQTTLPYMWNRCSGFNNELDDTDSLVFYWNLNGAKPYIEDTGDQFGAERVDLMYLGTHGGIWPDTALYAMWNKGQFAFTKAMRLGDESRRLSILSTYACKTLKPDQNIITRWWNPMSAGLRYVTGSHDLFWDGVTTDETGEDYADELQSGNTIKYAWRNASSDWWTGQDAAVMATGTTIANCANRRDTMRWQNFNSYPRLIGGNNAWFCWTTWENI